MTRPHSHSNFTYDCVAAASGDEGGDGLCDSEAASGDGVGLGAAVSEAEMATLLVGVRVADDVIEYVAEAVNEDDDVVDGDTESVAVTDELWDCDAPEG